MKLPFINSGFLNNLRNRWQRREAAKNSTPQPALSVRMEDRNRVLVVPNSKAPVNAETPATRKRLHLEDMDLRLDKRRKLKPIVELLLSAAHEISRKNGRGKVSSRVLAQRAGLTSPRRNGRRFATEALVRAGVARQDGSHLRLVARA